MNKVNDSQSNASPGLLNHLIFFFMYTVIIHLLAKLFLQKCGLKSVKIILKREVWLITESSGDFFPQRYQEEQEPSCEFCDGLVAISELKRPKKNRVVSFSIMVPAKESLESRSCCQFFCFLTASIYLRKTYNLK